MKIRVLIIDDEPLARDVIRLWLAKKPDVEIVGECPDGQQALAWMQQHTTDLVFLDVQMPEMNGFELLDKLRLSPMPVIIFVTAHDKYALRAFEAHALDYLLKPFDQERFDHAFDRAQKAVRQAQPEVIEERLRALLRHLQPAEPAGADGDSGSTSRLAVREGEKIIFVRTDDIHWLEASGDYVEVHTKSRRSLLHKTLGRLEAQLDARRFVRIHRSLIINVDQVREMEPYFNGEYHIVMQDGSRLKSSRTYRDNLRRLLSPA